MFERAAQLKLLQQEVDQEGSDPDVEKRWKTRKRRKVNYELIDGMLEVVQEHFIDPKTGVRKQLVEKVRARPFSDM